MDLSFAYAIGKVADDVAETPIGAVAAAMSDAAVANAARYIGLGASAVFLVSFLASFLPLQRHLDRRIKGEYI